MDKEQWEAATQVTIQVADYILRWAIVCSVLEGHEQGLSKDYLAERVRVAMERASRDAAADVVHYRKRLLADTTRAPLQ